MSFISEILPDAPIIIHSREPGPEMAGEIPESMKNLAELLSSRPQPVYLVMNLRGIRTGLDDLMKTSGDAARGPGAVLYHPNVIEALFVLSKPFVAVGAAGPTNEAHGGAKVRMFDTLDQALAYCHVRMAETRRS